MYIDLIVVVLLLLLVLLLFKRFSSFVYAVAIIDITLRILCFLKVKVPLRELGKIFPESIPAIFEKYTKDIVLDLLLWAYVFIYVCFLVYITSYFIKKKK
jgi:hypothetical protein